MWEEILCKSMTFHTGLIRRRYGGRWPKVRQPLEERRAYCPAVMVPAASSLIGLLPDYRLPYLVFQVMELQGLGSVYVLE